MPKSTGVRLRPPSPAVNIKKVRARRQELLADAPELIELTLAEFKGRLRGEGRHGDGRVAVVSPQTKEFGNGAGDRGWFRAAQAAGFIEPANLDEELPAGAAWVYTGPMIARASFWTWPRDGRLCDATSYVRDDEGHYILGAGNFQLKRPCARPPIHGGNVCIAHGGGIERVRRAAELRLLGAADSVIGALIEIALDTKADEKARVQAINSILDRAQIKGTNEVQIDIPLYREVIKAAFPAWGAAEDEEEAEDDADDND
jgi:hypothetical protein